MGYRSDGEIVVFGPKDVMTSHLAMLRMMPEVSLIWQTNYADLQDVYEREAPEGTQLVWHLKFSDWKWYETFGDIQAYEALWTLSREAEERGISGFRYRFGESNDDNEQDFFGDAADQFTVHISPIESSEGEDYETVERYVVHSFHPPSS